MTTSYGIDASQLRDYIITPTLTFMQAAGCVKISQSAVNLLLLTVAQESLGGKYLHQKSGPAVGIYQMEPATLEDHLGWADEHMSTWGDAWRVFATQGALLGPIAECQGNLYLATFFARVHYYRVPETLPAADDVLGLASYYKIHYNTLKGKATVAQAKKNYLAYTAGLS